MTGPSKNFDSVNTDQLSDKTFFVSGGDDLSSRLTNDGPGWFWLSEGTFEADKIPRDCHVRGQNRESVTLATSDPPNIGLTLAPYSSVGQLTLKDKSAPAGSGLTAGDPRVIGTFWNNRDTSDNTPKYWPDQGLNIQVAESGQDRPGVSVVNYGTGDALFAKTASGNGNAARLSAPSGSGAQILKVIRNNSGTLETVFSMKEDGQMAAEGGYQLRDSGGTDRAVYRLNSNDLAEINKGVAQNAPGSNAGDARWFADSGDFRVWDGTTDVAQFGATNGVRFNVDVNVNGNATINMRKAGLTPQSSAPSNASKGDIAVQDGANWNPTGSGNVEPVFYDGTSWNAT